MESKVLERLLQIVDEQIQSGQDVDVETLCAERPELAESLQHHIDMRNDSAAGKQTEGDFATQRENPHVVQGHNSQRLGALKGHRLVMQSELFLSHFCDRGGLGEVYRATDSDSSRELAVKLLRGDRTDPANQEDFKREAKIIGQMNHPGIVAIHGSGETFDGRPFYAMPFLRRGNLRQEIGRYHQTQPAKTVDTDKDFRDLVYRLVSVCKTIAYAHSRGVVHRDIKAENVLLGKYGETLVIDWGSATRVRRGDRFKIQGEETLQLHGIDESTSTGGITLRYASPEQLHGNRPVGPESDIYSLGATLYLLLAGKSPLENVPDGAVRGRVLAGEIDPPEQIKTGVPRVLAAICRKAMMVEPSQRYETALAMADDLERYLSDQSVSVCRDTAGVKLSRLIRRNRTASLTFLCGLMVAVGLLLLGFAKETAMAEKANQSARDRLQMAATMVATMGGMEIDRRIRMLEEQAADPAMVDLVQQLEMQPEDEALWNRAQLMLDDFKEKLGEAGVEVESVFLTDAKGLQLARAPWGQSVGENFAYRHYFHGRDHDLDPQAEEFLNSPPPPASFPVLSNAYVSTNRLGNNKYPVKSSFAVAVTSGENDPSRRVLGRLGVSIEINDLKLFKRISELSIDAVLVEMREYPWGSGNSTGLVVDRLRQEQISSSDADAEPITEQEVKDAMPRLSPRSVSQLSSIGAGADQAVVIADFHDPLFGDRHLDAAYAELRLPYQHQSATNWMVLFIDNEPDRR
jgi:hypothetical protein